MSVIMLRALARPHWALQARAGNVTPGLTLPARFLMQSAMGSQPETDSRVKGAFLGSLVADALCLGSHYEYDAPTIKAAYGGNIGGYMAPGEHLGGTTHGVGWGRRNYHPGQRAGDGTDYGEYNLLVLEFLASRPPAAYSTPIALAELLPFWAERLCSDAWGAWRCSQSIGTLQQLQGGERDLTRLGGISNAMSMRSAAAIAAFRDEDAAAAAARAVMFTHRAEEALVGGEFFTRVAWQVALDGATPREAIDAVSGRMSPWVQEQVDKGVAKYEEATDPTKPLAAEEFCDDLAMTSMAKLWDVGRSEPIKVSFCDGSCNASVASLAQPRSALPRTVQPCLALTLLDSSEPQPSLISQPPRCAHCFTRGSIPSARPCGRWARRVPPRARCRPAYTSSSSIVTTLAPLPVPTRWWAGTTPRAPWRLAWCLGPTTALTQSRASCSKASTRGRAAWSSSRGCSRRSV